MKSIFSHIDRRVIFVLVALALAIPLALRVSLPPARMKAADKLFAVVENLQFQAGDIAFVALDFGPNTKAENEFQAEVVVEHLMRRRLPFAVFSLYPLASPFLVNLPERLAKKLAHEYPGQRWEYGKDWVNLGYRYGGYLQIQSIPKAEDLAELFQTDAKGNRLKDLPIFATTTKVEQVKFLAQFTGLSGVFDTYIQYFQKKDYQPVFVHGCTSITIPEAFIYLASGQIRGLLEGIAGAAWYSKRLADEFPKRETDDSTILNTGLGVAHLIIILLVVLGNIGQFLGRRSGKQKGVLHG